jgi:hypothetical protein
MINHRIFLQVVTAATIICFAVLAGCQEDDQNTPPGADFTVTPGSGTPGTIFTFDASACLDLEDLSSTLQVRWDWENDGIFDTDYSTNKILNRQYDQPGTFQITLEVKDSGDLGNSITKSLVVTGSVPAVTTDSITNITENSANCGGEVTAADGIIVTARGVCWSTLPNPVITGNHTTDGSDTGKFVSHLTGLTDNTIYYVRAYATNIMGTAYGEELSFTTLDIWFCGDPFTINHVEGDVAPVTKTVTYGTVTNIPGEPSKCWITSNLGSDHQANAVDDATEASAGWYWQFNRMQGYKHDGTIRTPNTTWISSIIEDADWSPASDPCVLEFGNGWRIPTQYEWDNVEQWSDWNGPWNSALKMHAAGYLNLSGSLIDRGVQGYFWCNLQGSTTTGWYIRYRSTESLLAGNEKAIAITMRCVKD